MLNVWVRQDPRKTTKLMKEHLEKFPNSNYQHGMTREAAMVDTNTFTKCVIIVCHLPWTLGDKLEPFKMRGSGNDTTITKQQCPFCPKKPFTNQLVRKNATSVLILLPLRFTLLQSVYLLFQLGHSCQHVSDHFM
jgi:hypothetical protein